MPEPLAPSALKAVFLQDVPEPVILDAARCVLGSYDEAFRYCRGNYPGPEAHDLYPIVRRAMLERNLRARLSRYRETTSSTPELNAIGNCYHTELRSGRIILTVSAVETPGVVVRDAEFRKTLSQNPQAEMFNQPEPPPEDACLYAILLHGPLGGGMLSSPGFIQVAFPDQYCESYVDRFNLLEEFPVLRAEIDKLPRVAVERKALRLRRIQDQRAE
jgi:hypothetical protein